MTSHITHIWRLLKWGRTLARHGALRGIERDPLTPASVRRLVRLFWVVRPQAGLLVLQGASLWVKEAQKSLICPEEQELHQITKSEERVAIQFMFM